MTSEAHYLYGSLYLPSKTDKDVVYLSGSGYGSIAPSIYVKNGGEFSGHAKWHAVDRSLSNCGE